ncbi:MAG TPA: hypothetical protein VF145_04840, partial [Chitinophagaceae bacterium]
MKKNAFKICLWSIILNGLPGPQAENDRKGGGAWPPQCYGPNGRRFAIHPKKKILRWLQDLSLTCDKVF